MPEVVPKSHYAELAKWAGLAWNRSVTIDDQKPIAVPTAVEFRPYVLSFDAFKSHQSFARNWVSTDFRRVVGIWDTFDRMINSAWSNYSKNAQALIDNISIYADGKNVLLPAGEQQQLFRATTVTIQRCKGDAKKIAEACWYLNNEMSRLKFIGIASSLTRRTAALDVVLTRLYNRIPEKNRGLVDEIDDLKKQVDSYDERCAALVNEKEKDSIWPYFYIVAGSVALVSFLLLPGAVESVLAIRFIPGLVVAGYVGVVGSNLREKQRVQRRIDAIKGDAALLREGITKKLKQVGSDFALSSYITLKSDHSLFIGTGFAFVQANESALSLIKFYEKKLGKLEKINDKQEFTLAGEIGELINVFANNVRSISPTSAQREMLVAALAEFKPNPNKHMVGWNFDVVSRGMKAKTRKTKGVAISGQNGAIFSEEAKAAARIFNQNFLNKQIMQFGAFQRHIPTFHDINATSRPLV